MKHATFILVLGGLLCWVSPALAVVRTSPAVFDLEAFPHGDIGFTVDIINETGTAVNVYPMVGEFDAQSGFVTIPGTPYDANRLISANIELPRDDFTVAPGARRTLSGKVNVSPYIPPGIYHAVVAFSEHFVESGTGIRLDPFTPRALLNITVKHDIREHLNLNDFRAVRNVSFTFPTSLLVVLHNGGNVALTPNATISFFDRNGLRRGSVKLPEPVGGIAKNETATIPIRWSGDRGFGHYRAQIDVNYGVTNGGQLLTAAAHFWVIPWWILFLIGLVALVLSYLFARVIVRQSHHRHAP